MKPIPDERTCDWVRDRLPLLADRDGGDLASDGDAPFPQEDRLAVAAHLTVCSACLAHRDGLSQALDALWTAAGESPLPHHAPSLWPALQARIERRQAETQPRRTTDDGRRRSRARSPLERATSRIAEIRDDLPMQTAWLQDSAREEAPARLRVWLDADRAAVACDRFLRPLASPVGVLAAAVLLAIFVGLPLITRFRDGVETHNPAAEAPMPAVVQIPQVSPPQFDASPPVPEFLEPAPADLAVIDDRSLAQNTELPLRATEGQGFDVVPESLDAAPAAVRYDFDLERGTPMPPDSRIDKPAY